MSGIEKSDCKEYITLLQDALKKIAHQPCYNVIVYLRRTEQKY